VQTLRDVLTGAVGGIRAPGAVVVLRSSGRDDEEIGVGADPGQLFEVGSIAKTMTALLVLQHVERGQVRLDDPIATHLPVRLGDARAPGRVTVRHLLSHTSGLDCADDFTDTGNDDDCLERWVAEVLPEVGLLHEPGECWSYNNGGYMLLGRLVEVLDGRTFDDALIERVFEPLGLSATTTARLRSSHRVVTGHRFDHVRGAMIEEPGRMPRCAGPAGNVVATARDLTDFGEALFARGGGLLTAALVEEMVRPQLQMRDGGQGLAWVVPSPNLVVHGGSTRGCTAFLAVMPGVGSMCIVANGPGAGAIAGQIRAHLFGTPATREPGAGSGREVEPEDCAGRFARRNAQIELSWLNGELVATSHVSGALADLFPQPEPVVLHPVGGGRFWSSRPYEEGFGIWDFGGLDGGGVPMRLLTRRLLNRVG
jgi:CubicO group peptidase (beta-lactamase class C family)